MRWLLLIWLYGGDEVTLVAEYHWESECVVALAIAEKKPRIFGVCIPGYAP